MSRNIFGGNISYQRTRIQTSRTSGTKWISFRSREILEIMSSAASPVLVLRQGVSTTSTRFPIYLQAECGRLVQALHIVDGPLEDVLRRLARKFSVDALQIFR